MPEGVNKGWGYRDNFIVRMEKIATALEEAKKTAGDQLNGVVSKWVKNVERDAKTLLARPSWLLQESITNKVKDYGEGKVWAMAGFRFQSKHPRDPGYYGKYHEAGWAPDRKQIKVPDHFLRRAKKQNDAQLQADIKAALEIAMRKFGSIVRGV